MTETFTLISLITGALLKLVALLLLLALVPVVWSFRRAAGKLSGLAQRVHEELLPLIERANAVADDVHHVTQSIREDVAQVDETIAAANERVRAAIGTMEQRVQDFNALLEVVQEEAEDLFVSSAATVRGVRTGAAALTRRGGPEFAVDEGDGEAEAVDDLDDTDDLEMADGNDRATQPGANGGAAHPRLRPRARRRG